MVLKDIEQIIEAIKEIETIKKRIYERKKDSKENFNFFNALVTDKKIHLEKYHTNFIGYLLNPKQSHDCDVFFLKSFLELIEEKHEIHYNRKTLPHAVVTIEKQTTQGRFIDIVVEYKNEWILFVENKVYSDESENQLEDYYNFCFNKVNKKPIGIFLTRSGCKPTSIGDPTKIICISHSEIIGWLENCINQLGEKNNLTHSLKQYILALKQILNILDDEEMKVFQPYLDKNFQELPSLDVIDSFRDAVIKYSGNHEKRKIFYGRLIGLLIHDLEGEKSEKGFMVGKDEKRHEIIVCSYNEKYEDDGYGGWFGIYNQNKPFDYTWEAVEINGVDDFKDIVEGTKQIINLGENIDETVNSIAEYISSVIKQHIGIK